MKKYPFINIKAIFFLLLALGCFLYSWNIEIQLNHSSGEIPPLIGRIVDQAEVLTLQEKQALEDEIIRLEKATGGQMAILTIFTTGDQPIEEYSIKVADDWQIGYAGKDNGAILTLAIQDHRNRLEIGRGWEGCINDARAGDILRGMAPFLRKGYYADALSYAIRSVEGFVCGETQDLPTLDKSYDYNGQPTTPQDRIEWTRIIAVLFLLISFGCTTFGKLFFIEILTGSGSSGGGSSGGGSSGGGGYSGGGGSFSGGGASGRW